MKRYVLASNNGMANRTNSSAFNLMLRNIMLGTTLIVLNGCATAEFVEMSATEIANGEIVDGTIGLLVSPVLLVSEVLVETVTLGGALTPEEGLSAIGGAASVYSATQRTYSTPQSNYDSSSSISRNTDWVNPFACEQMRPDWDCNAHRDIETKPKPQYSGKTFNDMDSGS